jgi:hypothetical protein
MTGECAADCILIEANKSQHAALVSAWDQLNILLVENRDLRARLEHAPIEWVTFEDVEARLEARATAVLQGPLKQARSEAVGVPSQPPAVRGEQEWDTLCQPKPVCPWCGGFVTDSPEEDVSIGGQRVMDCDVCGHPVQVESICQIEYSTRRPQAPAVREPCCYDGGCCNHVEGRP